MELPDSEAHHVRDVLRLKAGDEIELFDNSGGLAHGAIERCDSRGVLVRIDRIEPRALFSGITIAAAVPKGQRADWMIEKLSELGVDRFIPLRTERSVVLPAGKSKRDRWTRIAIESAKQSRRSGVMQIEQLISSARLLTPSPGNPPEAWGEGLRVFLTTACDAPRLIQLLRTEISDRNSQILLLIGPEGGWTDGEIKRMKQSGLTGARLTGTILRVETAAVAAAAIVACWRAR